MDKRVSPCVSLLPGTKGSVVVTILLEGGSKCISHVLSSVEKEDPVVIIKGSGRAADFLSWAYEEKYFCNFFTSFTLADAVGISVQDADDGRFIVL